jgi:hypothetical protein
VLEALRRDGIVTVGQMPQWSAVKGFLDKRRRWPGHTRAMPAPWAECYSMEDCLRAPGFLDFARQFSALAAEYFGEPSILWSLNAFWTQPATFTTPSWKYINEFHRDAEAPKILTLFFFLTDVDEDGAHVFQKGTHNGAGQGEEVTIAGPAGTAFIADTRGLHFGRKPAKPRLIAWARWANVWPQEAQRLPKVRAAVHGLDGLPTGDDAR